MRTMLRMRSAILAVVLCACSGATMMVDSGPSDAGVDASSDAVVETPDAGTDAGSDAGMCTERLIAGECLNVLASCGRCVEACLNAEGDTVHWRTLSDASACTVTDWVCCVPESSICNGALPIGGVAVCH